MREAQERTLRHWWVGPQLIDESEDNTKRAFETSLNKLGLDHLDLYLMHQPFGDVYGQWRAMEALDREGTAKAIGVANFYPDRLIDLIVNNEIPPVVDQIETHPFFQRADYQGLMREHGVQIQSWGGFAEGMNSLFTNPLLAEIGKEHGKSVAQVVLRWLTQRGVIAIPKPVRAERHGREHRRLRLPAHRRADGPDRHPRHRQLPVLRPPRSRDRHLARQASSGRLTRTRHPRGEQSHRRPLAPPAARSLAKGLSVHQQDRASAHRRTILRVRLLTGITAERLLSDERGGAREHAGVRAKAAFVLVALLGRRHPLPSAPRPRPRAEQHHLQRCTAGPLQRPAHRTSGGVSRPPMRRWLFAAAPSGRRPLTGVAGRRSQRPPRDPSGAGPAHSPGRGVSRRNPSAGGYHGRQVRESDVQSRFPRVASPTGVTWWARVLVWPREAVPGAWGANAATMPCWRVLRTDPPAGHRLSVVHTVTQERRTPDPARAAGSSRAAQAFDTSQRRDDGRA